VVKRQGREANHHLHLVLGLNAVSEENLDFLTTYTRKADIDTGEDIKAIDLKIIIRDVYTCTDGEGELIECSWVLFQV